MICLIDSDASTIKQHKYTIKILKMQVNVLI